MDYSGKILDNKYELTSLLGEGGMGFVYLGKHVLIGKKVAVKFLHSALTGNKEAVKRFYREAQAAASIDHRNIIDVLDVGVTSDGEPYLVMEYLKGESLSNMLERTKGGLDLNAACAVMEPALLALCAAHEKKIVHRDMKPENIFMVCRSDGAPEIKIIDFGISKFSQAGDGTKLTMEGSMLGTPAYMSPEQAMGFLDVNHLVDVYAMGIIFYELLTGTTPYTGAQYNELLYNVLNKDPTPPSEVCEDFPDDAWPIIERAIQKKPEDRYSSALKMLEDIKVISTAKQRFNSLVMLGEKLDKDSFATGELGSRVHPTADTHMAADLLNQAINQKKPKAVYSKLAAFGSAIKYELTKGKRRWFFRIAMAAAVIIFTGLISAGLCSLANIETDSVLITVKGAPKNARIYYDDSLVPVNPFRVKRGEAIIPLRVEIPGRKKIKMSVIPSKNQIVNIRTRKIKATPKKQDKSANLKARKSVSKAKNTKEQTNLKNKKNQKTTDKKTTKPTKKKRKNPFKKLGRDIRQAFKKDK